MTVEQVLAADAARLHVDQPAAATEGMCATCGQAKPPAKPTPPEQLTRDALAGMTARQIEDARRAGALDELLGGKQAS